MMKKTNSELLYEGVDLLLFGTPASKFISGYDAFCEYQAKKIMVMEAAGYLLSLAGCKERDFEGRSDLMLCEVDQSRIIGDCMYEQFSDLSNVRSIVFLESTDMDFRKAEEMSKVSFRLDQYLMGQPAMKSDFGISKECELFYKNCRNLYEDCRNDLLEFCSPFLESGNWYSLESCISEEELSDVVLRENSSEIVFSDKHQYEKIMKKIKSTTEQMNKIILESAGIGEKYFEKESELGNHREGLRVVTNSLVNPTLCEVLKEGTAFGPFLGKLAIGVGSLVGGVVVYDLTQRYMKKEKEEKVFEDEFEKAISDNDEEKKKKVEKKKSSVDSEKIQILREIRSRVRKSLSETGDTMSDGERRQMNNYISSLSYKIRTMEQKA